MVSAEWIRSLPVDIPFNLDELLANPLEPRSPGIDELLPEGGEEIGEMNEEEKLLYSLWVSFEREKERAVTEARFAGKEEASVLIARAEEMLHKSKIFRYLFLVRLFDRLDVWKDGAGGSGVLLQPGFKVARVKLHDHSRLHSILDLLRS